MLFSHKSDHGHVSRTIGEDHILAENLVFYVPPVFSVAIYFNSGLFEV